MPSSTAFSTAPLDAKQIRLLTLAACASVCVALALTALKVWAWRATGSVAMLSSLADSLLDLLASLITLFAVRVAIVPADREHRFGHGKSEGIAGVVQAVIVSGSAAYVCLQAIERFFAPSPVESPATGYFVMACSMTLTFVLVVFQRHVVKRTGSLAIAADAVHYRADFLTTLAVLAAVYLSSEWGLHGFDPFIALVVVGLILRSVAEIVRDALKMLLDRELPDDVRHRIETIALAHPEVRGVHDLRTRSSGATQFIQFHVELDPGMELSRAHAACDAVDREVRDAYPGADVLIHADPYGLTESRDPY